MVRARKLFPIYGSALANRMLAAIERGPVISDFVAAYIDKNDRRGILGGASRDRELKDTIGREIVLAMIVEVHRVLPRFFGKTQTSKLRVEEKEASDAFLQELTAALDRAWNWQSEDRRQFQRDLDLYSDFALHREALISRRKRGKSAKEESPFVARVALLLDPSMLEEGQRAARKFHESVESLAQRLLKETLRPGGR